MNLLQASNQLPSTDADAIFIIIIGRATQCMRYMPPATHIRLIK